MGDEAAKGHEDQDDLPHKTQDSQAKDSQSKHSQAEHSQAPEEEAPAVAEQTSVPAEVALKLSRSDARSVAINGLFTLAVLYTVHVAATLLIPITLAVLVTVLLSPIVNRFEEWGANRTIAALLVVNVLVGAVLLVAFSLIEPARTWIDRLPRGLERLEWELRDYKKPLEEITKATEQLEKATDLGASPGGPARVSIERPLVSADLFDNAIDRLIAVGVFVSLLFLLLSSGDTHLRKLVSVIPRFEDKKRAVEIIRGIERDIAFYLRGLSTVNLALGAFVGLTCWALDYGNPLLWAALATVVSFMPYLGAMTIAAVLLLVGVTSDAHLPTVIGFPLGFLTLAYGATNFALPRIVGWRLTLSPLSIFLSIIFWGWMWGLAGALIAVPLLVSLKIVSERVDSLRPVATFLTP